jgi:archaeosine-15-forming tRNA-guanine transglycosylase
VSALVQIAGFTVVGAILLRVAAGAGYQFGRNAERERWVGRANYSARTYPREVHTGGSSYVVLERSAYAAMIEGKRSIL